jgi:hypothetical protein
MKVKAKQAGQYQGTMHYPGDVFDIEVDACHPAPWMEPIPEIKEVFTEPIVEEKISIPPVEKLEEKKEVKTKKKRWFK